jgi:hypothetical protein
MKSNKQTWKFTDQEIRLIYVALLTLDPQDCESWQHIGLQTENVQETIKNLKGRLGYAVNHQQS